MPASAATHPVWTLYDRLRSARLSVKYYGCRLHLLERQNFWLEFMVAVAAPTSAVAGLWFMDYPVGKTVWQWMGVLAAVGAVAKPLLGWSKRIKEYDALLAGYRTLEYDLLEIKAAVEQKGRYDPTLQADLRKAIQRERALVSKIPEPRESMRVKRSCQAEVNNELPAASFFIPQQQ